MHSEWLRCALDFPAARTAEPRVETVLELSAAAALRLAGLAGAAVPAAPEPGPAAERDCCVGSQSFLGTSQS